MGRVTLGTRATAERHVGVEFDPQHSGVVDLRVQVDRIGLTATEAIQLAHQLARAGYSVLEGRDVGGVDMVPRGAAARAEA